MLPMVKPLRQQPPARFAATVVFVLVMATAAARAVALPLWFDEIATFHLSSLGSWAELQQALLAAADAQPPLIFFLTKTSLAVIGSRELATRLPALLGFAVFLSSLYVFLAPRAGAVHAVSAMLFAALSWGFGFSHEGRPYGLLIGLSALVFLAWTRVDEETQRGGRLAFFALAVGLLVSTHYYAVVLLAGVGVGEVVRSWRRRRLDAPVAAILCLAPALLLPYLPFVAAVRQAYEGAFFSRAAPEDLYGFYVFLLAPAFFPLLAAMVAGGVVGALFERESPKAQIERGSSLALHERAAAFMLAATPMVYVGLAYATDGAFTYRYAIGSLSGVAIVFGDTLYNWIGPRRIPAWTLCGALLIGFGVTRMPALLLPWSGSGDMAELEAELGRLDQVVAESEEAILAASPHTFLQYAFYSAPELRRRMQYASLPSEALELLDTDSAERALANLAPWAGLAVSDPERFLHGDRSYWIAETRGHRFDWITKKLRSEEAGLKTAAEMKRWRLLYCCRYEESDARAGTSR